MDSTYASSLAIPRRVLRPEGALDSRALGRRHGGARGKPYGPRARSNAPVSRVAVLSLSEAARFEWWVCVAKTAPITNQPHRTALKRDVAAGCA